MYFRRDRIYNHSRPRRLYAVRSVMVMTVRERVLAIKLLEQKEKHPDYLRKLGVSVRMHQVESAIVDMNEEEKEIV